MALTVTQKPNAVMCANSPCVFVLSESASGTYNGYKFKYLLKVKVNTIEVALLKVFKNKENKGIIDISHIIKSYIQIQKENIGATAVDTPSGSIHKIGIDLDDTRCFSQNTSAYIKVDVEPGVEVAATATGSPVATYTAGQDSKHFVVRAGFQFIDGIDYSGGNYHLANYLFSTSSPTSMKFMTNAPTRQFVRDEDYLTLAFTQEAVSSTNGRTDGVEVDYMWVHYYDSSGAQITPSDSLNYLINSNGTGGANKTQCTTVTEGLLYFGCGPANLEAQGVRTSLRPSNIADWAYYIVYGSTGLTGPNTPNAVCSKEYYFYRYGSGASKIDDRHQSCTRFDNIRLAFENRLGAWDYVNFRGKSTETLDVKSSHMEQAPGTWDSTTFLTNEWDRGKTTVWTKATRRLKAVSDWLNEDEAVWLEELFTSPTIEYISDDGNVYPMISLTPQYTKKTSVNDKLQIQYTILLEYANPVNTNS
jgi:hypothetical protein